MQIGVDEIDLPEPVRAEVEQFFVAASRLGPRDLDALRRERRRRGARRLSTDRDFLQAVAAGTWGSAHDAAARQIRARARAQVAEVVPWPRRAGVARVLEEVALAVLSEADPQHPLAGDLCARLLEPWQRVVGRRVPTQRSVAGAVGSVGAAPPDDGEEGLPHDHRVQSQRPVLDVVQVQSN